MANVHDERSRAGQHPDDGEHDETDDDRLPAVERRRRKLRALPARAGIGPRGWNAIAAHGRVLGDDLVALAGDALPATRVLEVAVDLAELALLAAARHGRCDRVISPRDRAVVELQLTRVDIPLTDLGRDVTDARRRMPEVEDLVMPEDIAVRVEADVSDVARQGDVQ